MTLFILLAAVLVLIALAFLIHSLRDTQRRTALFLIMTLPFATLGLYAWLGNPAAIEYKAVQVNPQQPQDINTAIAELEQELKNNPNNIEGWLLLARSQMEMQKFDSAIIAFKKAREIKPDDADIKAEQAEAMLRASGKREFSPEALALLEDASKANPNNQRALFFLGMHYLQQGNAAKAEDYLQRLLPKLDTKAAIALTEQINLARKQQNKPPLKPLPVTETIDGLIAELHITIDVSSDLANKIKAGDILFVFAKTLEGSGPPVAAKRIVVDTFPIVISLSDKDSLMPTAKFSSQDKVQILARISRSGAPTLQSGDIEADAVISSTNNTNTVHVHLSRVTP